MRFATWKRFVPAVVVAALAMPATAQEFVPLFNGNDLAGWKYFLDPKAKDADPAKTAVVKDGEIQVTGFPNGYFYTEKPYKNYVLRYSWTYPKDQPEKTTMNSGCLIHIQEPHKIWPRSVEPQCRYMDHGKLFFIGLDKVKDKTEQNFNEQAQKKALKESHEWNTTEVTASADGSIQVRINGQLVTTGKSALTEGPIGFQSEGARIHFKKIEIKSLPEARVDQAQAEVLTQPKKLPVKSTTVQGGKTVVKSETVKTPATAKTGETTTTTTTTEQVVDTQPRRVFAGGLRERLRSIFRR
ncbi:MAG: DUF1080 domain-containing protein [Gemmataceae bacterium]|nr:DUF1080 domain-containing protein [Gemmataceae bacterium]MCI0739275.1 DUF1080 domain-containing protein [Gemmataceae bacterium]